MTELISLKEIPREIKIKLLEKLNYKTNGIYVMDSQDVIVRDRYTAEQVRLDNMLIFPGSTIILDDNPLSVSSFLEEFGDVL